MAEVPDRSLDLLLAARDKAQRLMDELVKKQADLHANPPGISAEKVSAGHAALAKAIDSVKETIAALDNAIRVTQDKSN